jgi:hypothetical protein
MQRQRGGIGLPEGRPTSSCARGAGSADVAQDILGEDTCDIGQPPIHVGAKRLAHVMET